MFTSRQVGEFEYDDETDAFDLIKQRRQARESKKKTSGSSRRGLGSSFSSSKKKNKDKSLARPDSGMFLSYDDMYGNGEEGVSKALREGDRKASAKQVLEKKQAGSGRRRGSMMGSLFGGGSKSKASTPETKARPLGSGASSSGVEETKEVEEEVTPTPLAEFAAGSVEPRANGSVATGMLGTAMKVAEERRRRDRQDQAEDATRLAAAAAQTTGNSKGRRNTVQAVQGQSTRGRSASTTSVDKVYGRLGRASAAGFQQENPLANDRALASQRRRDQESVYGKSQSQNTDLSRYASGAATSAGFFRERRSTITSVSSARRRDSLASAGTGKAYEPPVLESGTGTSPRAHRRSVSEDTRDRTEAELAEMKNLGVEAARQQASAVRRQSLGLPADFDAQAGGGRERGDSIASSSSLRQQRQGAKLRKQRSDYRNSVLMELEVEDAAAVEAVL